MEVSYDHTPRQQNGSNAERVVSMLLVINGKLACHKRRKWGGGGGGGVPTLPTVYILQYCSIVDVVPHLCPLTEGNHSFVV